jgi:hypothetical protein
MLNSARFSPSNMLIYILLGIILLPKHIQSYTTIINFEYYTAATNYQNRTEDTQTNGIVSSRGSQSKVRLGQAFVLVDSNGNYDGCQEPLQPRNYPSGIAIIQRGGNCTFSVKITRASQLGAAGDIEKLASHSYLFLVWISSSSCYHL